MVAKSPAFGNLSCDEITYRGSVADVAMVRDQDADDSSSTSPKTINRRKLLRTAAAAGGVGGLGMITSNPVSAAESDDTDARSVSKRKSRDLLRRDESKAALSTAGIEQQNLAEASLVDITGPKQRTERWVTIPAADDSTFGYNTDENIAEVVTGSNSVVRATPRDGDIVVEDLRIGDDTTKRALQTLELSAEFEQALQNASVEAVEIDEAAASFDRESGTTMASVPAECGDGSDVLLMAEIAADDSLKAVYGLPSTSEGGVQLQANSGIDCWAGCISFGLLCSNVCVPCVSVPTPPTCAPCAVCVGITAGSACLRQCDLPKFW
jgi:hypothetical protein